MVPQCSGFRTPGSCIGHRAVVYRMHALPLWRCMIISIVKHCTGHGHSTTHGTALGASTDCACCCDGGSTLRCSRLRWQWSQPPPPSLFLHQACPCSYSISGADCALYTRFWDSAQPGGDRRGDLQGLCNFTDTKRCDTLRDLDSGSTAPSERPAVEWTGPLSLSVRQSEGAQGAQAITGRPRSCNCAGRSLATCRPPPPPPQAAGCLALARARQSY